MLHSSIEFKVIKTSDLDHHDFSKSEVVINSLLNNFKIFPEKGQAIRSSTGDIFTIENFIYDYTHGGVVGIVVK